jgi:hypothetical protein
MLKRKQLGDWQPSLGVEVWALNATAVAVVALMVAVVAGSDGLVSDIARVVGSFQAHSLQSEAGGYTMIEDGPSVCCEGFYTGGRLALAFVLLGGIPLAIVGLVLARQTDRAGRVTWATRWEPLVRWCLVFQLVNLGLAGFLAVLVLGTLESFGPFVAKVPRLAVFLVANVGMSALAVRAWRAVQRSARANEGLGIGR